MGMGFRASSSSRVRRLLAAASLAAVALSAPSAAAEAPPERAEYVSRLETICKPGVEATQRAVRGVRSDIRAERLAVAAGKLGSAARIFDGTVGEITTVPRPAPDRPQLAKWFRYLRLQEAYLAKAAAALRAERVVQYQHNAVRFVHNGNLANDVVISFGFDYCRFQFSRFE
jgi:uncharacterized membrane protein